MFKTVRKIGKNGKSFYWKYEYFAPGARVVETFGEDGTMQRKFVYHDSEMYADIISFGTATPRCMNGKMLI